MVKPAVATVQECLLLTPA